MSDAGLAPLRRALISVSDKTGIVEFAQALSRRGVEILSTGGTCRLLREEGVDVITLDVAGGSVHSTAPAKQACFLHAAPRECQIAIVLRDQERGEERTVAVFPGL